MCIIFIYSLSAGIFFTFFKTQYRVPNWLILLVRVVVYHIIKLYTKSNFLIPKFGNLLTIQYTMNDGM